MKKALMGCLCVAAVAAMLVQPAKAVTITTTAPQVKVYVGGVENTTLTNQLNNGTGADDSIPGAMNRAVSLISDKPFFTSTSQNDLARGFGDAGIYANQASTLQGYQDYDLFALTAGFMLGSQLPSIPTADEINNMSETVKKEGDPYLGIGIAVPVVTLGVNLGLLVDGLYLSVRGGGMNLDIDGDDNYFKFEKRVYGAMLNYSLFRTADLGWGFAKWRGLSFGTGLLYQSTNMDWKINMDSQSKAFVGEYDPDSNPSTNNSLFCNGEITIDPSVNLGLKSESYTIPLDVTTSIQLLYAFNLNLGAGVDVNMGSSDVILTSAGAVTVKDTAGSDATITTTTPGAIVIDGSTRDESPTLFKPRLMTGVGLQAGPVKLDMPLIWYPKSGMAIGLSVGFVW